MDNAQKAIMIGVGLFITIIIISAVMLITSAGQDLINNSSDQIGNISSSLQAQLTSQFDETLVNGSQVISAVKANYTTEGMAIVVANSSGSGRNYGLSKVKSDGWISSQSYNIKGISYLEKNDSPTPIGWMTNSSYTSYYVSSTEKFRAHLIKCGNSVVGIYFDKNGV